MKPNRSPQKGEPIFKRVTSDIVTIKDIVAPRVKCPLKATEKLRLRTFRRAMPTRVAMNAFGVANIRAVNKGDNRPKTITPMQTRIAAVY